MNAGSYIEGEEYHGFQYDYRDYPKVPQPPTGFLQLSQTIEEEGLDLLLEDSAETNDSPKNKNIIDVCLRIKPSKNKSNPFDEKVLEVLDNQTVVFKQPKELKSSNVTFKYKFSNIYGPHVTQADIFQNVVYNMQDRFLKGEDALLFTFGTTNSGKTFTIQGTVDQPGIIPRTLNILFNSVGSYLDTSDHIMFRPALAVNASLLSKEDINIQQEIKKIIVANKEQSYYTATSSCTSQYSQAYSHVSSKNNYEDESSVIFKSLDNVHSPFNLSSLEGYHTSVWICFFEVYNENIYDLLDVTPKINKKNKTILKIARDQHQNVYIKDLTYVHVHSSEEAYKVLRYGKNNLSFASTNLNQRSSRSHCVFSIKLIVGNPETEECIRISNFDICDLAGTERQKKAQTTGDRLKEARTINSSLHVLTRCFNVLRENTGLKPDKKKIVPYRDSKLTQIFQRSLNGNRSDVTVKMIVNVNTSPHYGDETLQVLKISAVARDILTVAKPKKTFAKKNKKSRFSMIVSQANPRNVDCWQDSDSLFGRGSEDYNGEGFEDPYDRICTLETKIAEYEAFNKIQIESEIREECWTEFQEMIQDVRNDWSNDVESLKATHKLDKQRCKEFYMKQIRELRELITEGQADEKSMNDSLLDDDTAEHTGKSEDISACYKEEIERLTMKNKELHEDKKNLGEKINELTKANSELTKSNEQLKKDVETLQMKSVVVGDGKDVKYLKNLLNEAKEDYKIQQDEIQELRVEVEELLEQKRELEVKCSELEDDLEKRDTLISVRTELVEELQEKIDYLETKIQEESVEHERVINIKEEEIIKLRRDNMEKSQQLEDSKLPLRDQSTMDEQALQKEIKNITALLVSRDTDIRALKEKVRKYEKWYVANKTDKGEKEKLIASLEARCEQLSKEVNKLQENTQSFIHTIQNMEADEQSLKANHEKLLEMYEERLNKCQDELTRERNESLKRQQESKAPVTNKNLEDQINNLKKELSEQQSTVRNLQLKLLQREEVLSKYKTVVESDRTPLKSLENQMANVSLGQEEEESDDPDFIPVRAKSATTKSRRTKPKQVENIQSSFLTPNPRKGRTKLFDHSPEGPAGVNTPSMADVEVETLIPSPKSQIKKNLRARRKLANN